MHVLVILAGSPKDHLQILEGSCTANEGTGQVLFKPAGRGRDLGDLTAGIVDWSEGCGM